MKMCEHMTITFIPLDAPASGDPGGDFAGAHPSQQSWAPLLRGHVWPRVSCRDLRPPLEIHGSGDSKLQSPAEFSDSDGGGDGGIQGLGATVISWIWGNVKSVGHQFGYLIGNAVGLVADDDDGRGV